MELLPHIDLIDPELITVLLSDPQNFSWRAIDSEGLDSWSPDIGLSSYPNPSIVRPVAVARSGMASTLRHRFWSTVERQADHTGHRYIGILIYIPVGEPCPMELRLGAHEIGRVEPKRRDNRLHLIVVDRAVRFLGEMEIFQLTAPGPGRYRIETFALLKERPAPARFIPQIDKLSVHPSPRDTGRWQADLHLITSEVASVQVELTAEGRLVHQLEQPHHTALHRLRLSDLAPDTSYTATVTVTEPEGEQASESLTFTTRRGTPSEQPFSVPFELVNLADTDLSGLPLTFGVPLPQGTLSGGSNCLLKLGKHQQTAQLRTQATWPDGSARWVLIDGVVPPTSDRVTKGVLEPTSQPNLALDGISSRSQEHRLTVAHNQLTVTVDRDEGITIEQEAGQQQPLRLSFASVLGNELPLTSGRLEHLTVETLGHRRAVIHCVVPHEDEGGTAHLQSNLRIHLYAGKPFVKLVHRLEVISPALAPAAAGGVLAEDVLKGPIGSAVAGTKGEASTLLTLRSFALQLSCPDVRSVAVLGRSWDATEDWRLLQKNDHGYAVFTGERMTKHQGRATGQFTLEHSNGSFGVGIKDFWQTYPKGLRVQAGAVEIELFPALTAKTLPDEHESDPEAWHRLYFWLQGGLYRLKAGMALTSELVLDLAGETGAVFDWLENPPVVRPALEHLNRCRALGPIGSKTASLLPRYEALADEALTSFHRDQAHFRAFGQLNYGDWYGESGWSWGNNEYDPAYCAYIEFLRGGEPAWATWGAKAVRHLVDVDTLNHSADPSEIGGQAMHMPGHLGGYLPALFRSKMKGTNSIPSHTWVEGPLLHLLLTGDETVRESIEKTKGWLLQKRWFDCYDFSNCREAGWHLIHLCMLASATDDPMCLNAAALIVRRVLERQSPEGGWLRMLTESHCGCGYPRCRGEAGFMVGVLLSGLQRYHHLTGDRGVAESIIAGARWLIAHTFDEASGHFRYTSCRNRSLGGGFQQTQWVLEGLADAYEISGDAVIGSYVERGLAAIGRFPEGLDHLGLGKAMAQQMRYVPAILAALEKRPLRADS
ncbi:MAG: hypothetical protein JSV66_12270 [Trueperaceae bacterium]|nr:MAG: hypothetical protein JSV66_12270 [Trueperaceae bacterium]